MAFVVQQWHVSTSIRPHIGGYIKCSLASSFKSGGSFASFHPAAPSLSCSRSPADNRRSKYKNNRILVRDNPRPDEKPLVSFPGGGMFFYWQIGATEALEKYYDMADTVLVGASAGALAATLTACGVSSRTAAKAAFRISVERNLWDRDAGLAGCWGQLVREWLHELLPDNTLSLVHNRLHLYVIDLPSIRRRQVGLQRRLISEFESKDDVIDCCMASVHIPFFMDGRMWTWYRGRRCIDGSILTNDDDFKLFGQEEPLILDYSRDADMKAHRWAFLELGSSPDATWQWIESMMDCGYRYVEKHHNEGLIKLIPKNRMLLLENGDLST